MKKRLVIIALLALSLSCNSSWGQSLDALNSERKAAQREIELLDKELADLKNSSADVEKKLRLTTARLQKRQQVLRSIDKQLTVLSEEEKEQSSAATEHMIQLENMRKGFAETARKLYRMQLLSDGNELLQSDSSQLRNAHFNHLSIVLLSEIKQKSAEINEMRGIVGEELRNIAERKEKLAGLKADEAVAVSQIAIEQRNIVELEAKIKGQTSSLNRQKELKIQALNELQKQITRAIEQEMAKSKKEGSVSENIAIDTRYFAENKGKLPTPMVGSKITDNFGLHAHPTIKGVKVDNKGVNLEGSAFLSVRVVADGEVRKVFMVPGMGASILVRHGEYLTVYSNLSKVGVSGGQKIKGLEKIGEVGSDGMLHFEVWMESKTENPTTWVKF